MPSKSKQPSYYAIYQGRVAGVVTTWRDCYTRVHGYPGAKYKKFSNQDDAKYYSLHGVTKNKSTMPSSGSTSIMDFVNDTDTTPAIHVYTDGSCLYNGTPRATAGYGVWFGVNDPRNISLPVSGRQTNNRAELTAILAAVGKLKAELLAKKRIIIHTDSEYSMKCVGEYGRKLEATLWKGFGNQSIPNLDLIKQGVPLFRQNPTVSLRYIKAHTGDSDRHSQGNAMADSLAVSGAKMGVV